MMARRLCATVVGSVSVALLGVLVPSPPASADPDPFGEVSPVVVVMDVSGSMDFVDDLNERRIDVARSAMLGLVRDLGQESEYGMIAYPGGNSRNGCSTGELRTQLAPLDAASASADIRRLRPDGDTPTGPALQHALEVLQNSGYRRGTVVLVSDGDSNCGSEPCEVAQRIVESGFDMTVYPVGFHLAEPNDELSCVAEVTGGEYVDASNATDLAEALGQAVPARLVLQPHVPDVLSVRTGTYDDLTRRSQISATVRSDGRLSAHDVRVSLTLINSVREPILIARPIRYLGNLSPGESRTITFAVRPEEQVVYADWELIVTARNAAMKKSAGRLDINQGIDLSDVGPLLDGIEHVVVMGDSYSVGEGTGTYLSDSPGACHRSGRNYGGWLYEDGADNIACSGAVTADLTYPDESGGTEVPAQLKQLRNLMLGEDPPQAVFLSIGGNDAGFGGVATWCVLTPKCGIPVGGSEGLVRMAGGVATDIWHAVGHVDEASNDSIAQEKRGSVEIPIIVLPYPRITPEIGSAVKGCQFGLSTREIDMLNPYIDALNRSVKSAVDRLRANGRPVYYASFVVDAFQPNHTICEGVNRSFANMDNFPAAQQQAIYGTNPEVLHPNINGYEAEARAIVVWSHTVEARPVEVSGTVTWDPSLVKDARPEPQTCIPLMCLLEPGGTGEIARSGYAPGSTVTVRLASTPRTVGSFAADEQGGISGAYVVPTVLEPGDHHLEFVGVDPGGRMRVDTEMVHVYPRGTGFQRVAGALGLILVLIGGAGFVTVRRPQTLLRRTVG